MPGPWNHSTERMLLLCIIDPKATPKWDRVAARMGPQFSGEACRQKFYKLRNESASIGADPGSASASARPKKRKRKTQQSANDQAQYDDTEDNDANAGAGVRTQLISDRPFNKKHREDQLIQPHQVEETMEETPSNGSKVKEEVKQEGIDKVEYASGSEYTPDMA